MIQLIVNITPDGISVIRCDGKIPDFKITIADQASNPKLGTIVAGRNLDDAIRAIQDCVQEATGEEIP
jgi:hypothetical protein